MRFEGYIAARTEKIMKASWGYAKKMVVPAYYISIGIFLFICSVALPFQYAEIKRIAYTNNLFSEYKQANQLIYVDENNPAARQIRKSGHEFGKLEYRRLSGTLALLSCLAVLGLTLFISFARATDVIWIGGYFSLLFSYGSMTTEFYVGILLLAAITFFIKKRIERNRKSVANAQQ
jgi:hypothetical protein